MREGNLFILSAPSGTGKTTLAKALIDAVPDTMLSISYTTRAARPGEREGVDYYFIEESKFLDMVSTGKFLEYAKVFGNWYGTAFDTVEKFLSGGKNVVLDIDWQGARKIRERIPATSIFLLPPSRDELEQRLRKRGQDSDLVIARRMREAAEEMRHYCEYDYVVVNDDIDAALSDLRAIIENRPEVVRPLEIEMGGLLRDSVSGRGTI
ncbi:MAG: guanylate kinase [Gammaproteobacteria bacterium]|nr:guanylate kinase [Gammaproteobacteria bacterium]